MSRGAIHQPRWSGGGPGWGLNTTIAGFAWRWVLWTTVLQVVDGVLLLLPRPVLSAFMQGGAATMIPLTRGTVSGRPSLAAAGAGRKEPADAGP